MLATVRLWPVRGRVEGKRTLSTCFIKEAGVGVTSHRNTACDLLTHEHFTG